MKLIHLLGLSLLVFEFTSCVPESDCKNCEVVTYSVSTGQEIDTSCVPESDCKNCEVVTYSVSTGQEIDRQIAIEYCGPSLDEKENTDPIVNGDERIVWECQ